MACDSVRALAWAAAGLLMAVGAHAEGADEAAVWRVDASARVDAFHSPERPDDRGRPAILTGQFKAEAKWSSATRAFAETRLATPRHDAFSPGQASDSRLLEAYVAQPWGDSELRVGKQILAWGRADGVNPTDNLSPRDFVTWLPFDDDQRFGTWAARWSAGLGAGTELAAAVAPRFEGSVVPVPQQPYPVDVVTPSRTWANTAVALKLNRSGARFDWSLSYLHGLSLLPAARVKAIDVLGPRLEFRHDRVHVLGADAAWNAGRFGMRVEAALTRPTASDDGGPAMRHADFFWAGGADRTLGGNLNVNLQLFGRHVMNFTDPYSMADPLQRQVAIQNAITVGQQDRNTLGLSLRISDKWLGETLQGELLLVDSRTRNTRSLRPLLSYAITDTLKAAVGAVLYSGADDTLFGRKKSNNRFFLELRYSP